MVDNERDSSTRYEISHQDEPGGEWRKRQVDDVATGDD
jgi:hypothetical protein